MYRIAERIVLTAVVLAVASSLPAAEVISLTDAAEAATRLGDLPSDGELVIETVKERYADGNIRSERTVARTVELNYVNHGEFQMWDEDGNPVANGRYDSGRRVGKWTRTYRTDEAPLFSQQTFKRFTSPFVSEANFDDDMLNGMWKINDAEGRKVSEIQFKDGLRNGKLVYYFPSGKVAREIDYNTGLIDGFDRTFDDDGNIVSEEQYIDGRRYVLKQDIYLINKRKKLEGYFLHPRTFVETRDDWWTATMATTGMEEGIALRHGPYKAWHINGQISVQGDYEFGDAKGEFIWWHSNGQISLRGGYADGKHDGLWHWWHANGMKSAEGQYDQGNRIGRWLSWKEDGMLSQVKKYDQERELADGEGTNEPTAQRTGSPAQR